jgi:hypothetical protein
MGLVLSLAGGGISWAVHEIVDSSSAKAVIANRIAEHAAKFERQTRVLDDQDERLRALEVGFAKQAEQGATLARIIERMNERDRPQSRARGKR